MVISTTESIAGGKLKFSGMTRILRELPGEPEIGCAYLEIRGGAIRGELAALISREAGPPEGMDTRASD